MENYFIILAAGNRVNGAKQFGSAAEEAAHIEDFKWLQELLGSSIQKVYSSLGSVMATLEPKTAQKLQLNPKVLSVQKVRAFTSPATVQADAGWGLSEICGNFTTSFTYTYTGHDVLVYVLDTGIDLSHTEYTGRATTVYDATNGALPASNILDYTHGTNVASVIGGTLSGVAKECIIENIIVQTADGGTAAWLVDGIDYLLTNHTPGVKAIVNISVGGFDASVYPEDASLEEIAVASLLADGLHCVTPAGNYSRQATLDIVAQDERLVVVGASGAGHTVASFTNYGTRVDLFAPGVDVIAAVPGGTFSLISGTSISSALVAGIMAGYLEHEPSISPINLKELLHDTASPIVLHDLAETTDRLAVLTLPILPLRVAASHETGLYITSLSVQLYVNKPGSIRYTLDGTTPTAGSTLYSGAISVSSTTVLKFKAFFGSQESAVETKTYYVKAPFSSNAAFTNIGSIVETSINNTLTVTKDDVALLPAETFEPTSTVLYTNSATGDLVINTKVVNNFFSNHLIKLPEMPKTADTINFIPSASLKAYLTSNEDDTILEAHLTADILPTAVCSKLLNQKKVGYALLSLDNVTFSKFITLTAANTLVYVKLPKDTIFTTGPKFDLTFAAVTLL